MPKHFSCFYVHPFQSTYTVAIITLISPLAGERLLPGVFKEAKQTDMNYMLALDPDRLLVTYLNEVRQKSHLLKRKRMQRSLQPLMFEISAGDMRQDADDSQ